MDVKTGLVGIKRRVSYQSIAEQLYIEPHQGIKSQSFSRDQMRRAVSGLQRANIIEIQSEGKQLILKCLLASRYYSAQNKAAINPPQKVATNIHEEMPINKGDLAGEAIKADTVNTPKAATPLKEHNYIYLLKQFEQFWQKYPERKSRECAFNAFEQINPSDSLLGTMLQALDNQIQARVVMQSRGQWLPAWKYPANWLTQQCWEDEINLEAVEEKKHAKHRNTYQKQTTTSGLYIPDEDDEFEHQGTVLEFKKREQSQGD